jgi:hypothetical protein
MVNKTNLVGRRFGRLVIVEYSHKVRHQTYWKGLCDCGRIAVTRIDGLNSGRCSSCGCLRKERASAATKKRLTTHGKTVGGVQRIYRIWRNMINRCHNKNVEAYKNYGARGIIVCDRWKDFSAFLLDMGEPALHMTLDRINNDDGYNKGNCRWATRKEQSNNTRQNRKITINGMTMNISQWAEHPNAVDASLISCRLGRGWDAEKAVFKDRRIRNA